MTRTDFNAVTNRSADDIRQALRILQQSSTGAQLYDFFKDAGYTIERDPEFVKRQSKSFRGFCDHARRRILTGAISDPLELALLLGHEMRHVKQLLGLRLSADWEDDLRTSIAATKIIEADAYAHAGLIAAELFIRSLDKNAAPVLRNMASLIRPALCPLRVLEAVAENTVHLANGKALAAGFEAFFDLPKANASYEASILQSLEAVSDRKYLNTPGIVQRSRKPSDLMQLLLKEGSYGENLNGVDITDERHSGFDPASIGRIINFETRMAGLGRASPHEPPKAYIRPPIPQERKEGEFFRRFDGAVQKISEDIKPIPQYAANR